MKRAAGGGEARHAPAQTPAWSASERGGDDRAGVPAGREGGERVKRGNETVVDARNPDPRVPLAPPSTPIRGERRHRVHPMPRKRPRRRRR